MKIWKNTSTLDGYDHGLSFTDEKKQAQVILVGSKTIYLDQFPNLKGIFRAGIGKENIPEAKADALGIQVCYPSEETKNIIYEETAAYTCSLIMRVLYCDTGSIEPWRKFIRPTLSSKRLLVIGTGNIGMRVNNYMKTFMNVDTFDTAVNKLSDLKELIKNAHCITLHIPSNIKNKAFMDKEKLGMMTDGASLVNTARASIVDEQSLYDEVSKGRLRAAFDVFWEEPYNGKLKEFEEKGFYMSPHIASFSDKYLQGCRQGVDELIANLKND